MNQRSNTSPAFVEGVKLVFDGVRNYSLCALIALGGSALSQGTPAMLPISWFKYGEWVLYGLAILLGIANVVYMTEVFERTQFFLQRKWKVAWQLFHLAISSAIGLLLVGAAMSMRIPGAG